MLEAGETFGEIESVKAVADLNTPVAGTVLEVNVAIEEHLEILFRDPWNEGWMIKIAGKAKDLEGDGLIDAANTRRSWRRRRRRSRGPRVRLSALAGGTCLPSGA